MENASPDSGSENKSIPTSPSRAAAAASSAVFTTATASAGIGPPALPAASHGVSKRPASSPPPAGKRIHLSNRENASSSITVPSSRRKMSSMDPQDKENRFAKSNRGPKNNNIRIIVAHSTQHEQYLQGMRRMSLRVKPVIGDGNCLFRAVADQIYGDESLHGLVRNYCMLYMKNESSHFFPIVSALAPGDDNDGQSDDNDKKKRNRRNQARGGDGIIKERVHKGLEDSHNGICASAIAQSAIAEASSVGSEQQRRFNEYIRHYSEDGVWGGDPEITAICEIYDRPAQFYVFDRARGARQRRTFHHMRSGFRPPIRLSYYGGGHYDSVVGTDTSGNYLRALAPGHHEQRMLQLSDLRKVQLAANQRTNTTGGAASAVSIAAMSAEERQYQQILMQSRQNFDISSRMSEAQQMEIAIAQSLRDVEPERAAVEEAKHASENPNAEPSARMAQTQASLLLAARQKTEEEQMRLAMALSMGGSDNHDAAAAAATSSASAGIGSITRAPILSDNERHEQQQRCERQQRSGAIARTHTPSHAHAAAGVAGLTEAEMIALAIQQSTVGLTEDQMIQLALEASTRQ